ncbi:ribokinase [Williamsia deligens]|uniref:ribokinase n=1 Tax=Williamsia deligens TaxID=321325 RepID=UPI0031D6F1E6
MQAAVVVVGSVNVDVVAELDRFPRPGETLRAAGVRRNVGGKGANQAVAARRVHEAVAFIGRVGEGPDGSDARAALDREGVDVTGLRTVADARTGTAFIQVADGENTIVLDPGANEAWDDLDDTERSVVSEAAVVVCQMEVPTAVTAGAADACTGRLIVNAAPAGALDATLVARCDPLVVNEHELAVLAGRSVDGIGDARAAAAAMTRRGARSVVVTLGARGAVWVTGDDTGEVSPPRVDVVDSTGAGDALVGVLAARLAVGEDLRDAVRWAVTAGSLAVRTTGTHAAYPDLATVADHVADIVSKS